MLKYKGLGEDMSNSCLDPVIGCLIIHLARYKGLQYCISGTICSALIMIGLDLFINILNCSIYMHGKSFRTNKYSL